MNEQLISFDTAKLAKEKGFDVPVRNFYPDLTWDSKELYHCVNVGFEFTNEVDSGFGDIFPAPTQSLLQKWLREVHGIHVQPQKTFHNKTYEVGKIPIEFRLRGESDDSYGKPNSYNGPHGTFNTYEEALEAGLKEALKLIKENNGN